MSRQLPLPVGLRDGNTLDAFLPDANPEALAAVRALLAGEQSFVFLWGPADSGRTHLLEGAVGAMAAREEGAVYLAAAVLREAGPQVLEGMADSAALVCVDDIDQLAGDRRWEEAIFHLFNAIRVRRGRFLCAAGGPPAACGFVLPDLASRLASGLVARLAPLDDPMRLAVLGFRAGRRGLDLPAETARYLLAHHSRRLADLVSLLGELERAASVHKRRLTVPFVRQVSGLRG